jgi:DNA-binding NarL/FixJ family response regulator
VSGFMKNILVVDDDITLKTILTRCLETRGYVVRQASSGVEGLRSFEKNPADLIVSDVMMPYMDGFEFCRLLRQLRSGQLVPFIFLSSCEDVEDRIQGHQMGADDYLVKPFEVGELVAKVEAQLARSHRIQSEVARLLQPVAPKPVKDLDSDRPPFTKSRFTVAEKKVFAELVQGLSNQEIADRLFISHRTVQSHVSKLLKKLGLETRSQIILYAFAQEDAPKELEGL